MLSCDPTWPHHNGISITPWQMVLGCRRKLSVHELVRAREQHSASFCLQLLLEPLPRLLSVMQCDLQAKVNAFLCFWSQCLSQQQNGTRTWWHIQSLLLQKGPVTLGRTSTQRISIDQLAEFPPSAYYTEPQTRLLERSSLTDWSEFQWCGEVGFCRSRA